MLGEKGSIQNSLGPGSKISPPLVNILETKCQGKPKKAKEISSGKPSGPRQRISKTNLVEAGSVWRDTEKGFHPISSAFLLLKPKELKMK